MLPNVFEENSLPVVPNLCLAVGWSAKWGQSQHAAASSLTTRAGGNTISRSTQQPRVHCEAERVRITIGSLDFGSPALPRNVIVSGTSAL
jgi:hypothetical protein